MKLRSLKMHLINREQQAIVRIVNCCLAGTTGDLGGGAKVLWVRDRMERQFLGLLRCVTGRVRGL